MSRLFNALNGRELAHVICAEVGQLLDLDQRFDRDDPITSAMVTFTLQVESLPNEHPFAFQVSNLFKGSAQSPLSPAVLKGQIKDLIRRNFDGDLRFGTNITYPKVSCEHRLNVELVTPNGSMSNREVVRVDTPMNDFSRPVIDTRGPVAVSRIIDPKEEAIADLERKLAELRGSVASDPTPTVRSMPAPHDFDPTTGTGMEMTRGWRQSPGDAMAQSFGTGSPLGQVQTREAIELGVTHPKLSDGGMPPPDAIRREHGLPVPQTQVVGNQVVDVIEGMF